MFLAFMSNLRVFLPERQAFCIERRAAGAAFFLSLKVRHRHLYC